jgi:hypothetical protein
MGTVFQYAFRIWGAPLLVLLFAAFLSSPIQAQKVDSAAIQQEKYNRSAPWYVKRFTVALGAFFPINYSRVTVGNEQGTFGTRIDMNSDLGLSRNSSTISGGIQWRAARRSRFDLNFYHINRSATKTLDKNIQFKDTTFPIHGTVSDYFRTDIYRFSYGYAIFCNARWEAGLSFGLHVLRSNLGIGVAGDSANAEYNSGFGFTAPLPDFGIWGGWAFAPKWALTSEVGFFQIGINGFNGRLITANLWVTREIIPNLNVAAGYDGLNFNLDVTKEHYKGSLAWGYNGPSIIATYSFGHKKW